MDAERVKAIQKQLKIMTSLLRDDPESLIENVEIRKTYPEEDGYFEEYLYIEKKYGTTISRNITGWSLRDIRKEVLKYDE